MKTTKLLKSCYPKVTVKTNNENIVKSVHGAYYNNINGVLYGKKDGLNGFKSEKIALRYFSHN